MKFIDFVIEGSAVTHPNKRTIIKLSFSGLEYFDSLIKAWSLLLASFKITFI